MDLEISYYLGHIKNIHDDNDNEDDDDDDDDSSDDDIYDIDHNDDDNDDDGDDSEVACSEPSSFFIGKLHTLPHSWLDAKRPYLLPSSEPCGPEVQVLKVIIDCPQPGSSRATYRPPPIGRLSKCGGNDMVMVLPGSGMSKVPKETQPE